VRVNGRLKPHEFFTARSASHGARSLACGSFNLGGAQHNRGQRNTAHSSLPDWRRRPPRAAAGIRPPVKRSPVRSGRWRLPSPNRRRSLCLPAGR